MCYATSMKLTGQLGDKMNLKFYIGIGMLGASLALCVIALLSEFKYLTGVNNLKLKFR